MAEISGPRKIIHIDMDAFFAAVEQRDFPEYRNRPVVVGGPPDSRGVVSTCSYEARVFGIRSAMPSSQAYRLCPHAIFLRPRFEAYREVSRQIRQIMLTFTERVEPLSLDEAYLDVSACQAYQGSATLIAREIKRRIRETTGLSASAGVSYNKFLAKIASDLDKPDGLYLITPEQGPGFVENLPVGRFHGIGKATEAKMQALGILTGKDLKARSLEELSLHFGKAGRHYHQIARGLDERPVVPSRPRKSMGEESTFQTDLDDKVEMLARLETMAGELLRQLAQKRLTARALTLKVRYENFVLVTRSKTLSRPFFDLADVIPHLAELLGKTEAGTRRVRLLGVSFSALSEEDGQPTFRQYDLFSL
ncbi:MAG: DNA polymerase IV [Methylococcaceae bacterium]|nr:DNA polymerase IV [Methylococcaceae bacterium]